MVLATAIPATATVSGVPVVDDTLVIVASSDGTWGIKKLSELPHAEAQADCYGIAPVDTACTLSLPTTYPNGGGWTVGWTAPATAAAPVGALYAHTSLFMTGTNGASITGNCEWAAVGMPNGAIFPPFPYGVSCLFQYNGIPAGQLNANFGVSDGHAFGTPGTPGGLGTWHAILIAT